MMARNFLACLMTAAVCLFAANSQAQTPAGTAFTYQGRLNMSGAPASGTHDFEFRLYDAPTGGNQIGATDGISGVDVDGGLFSVSLDFGAGAFGGDARWLEIAVRESGESGFTTLSPRTEVTPAPQAVYAQEATTADSATTASIALALSGTAYVMVKTTDSAVMNGQALLAAYEEAKALAPNGQPLSATNRAVLLVPPGQYDLTTKSLTLETEFVDLVGLATARENQYIFGDTDGLGTGVLAQTADDVRIENLTVVCTRNSGDRPITVDGPAAYFPDTGKAKTVVKNCAFMATNDDNFAWSTRVSIEYAGSYTDCTGGVSAFGGRGTASGTFINCTGGKHAFGGDYGGTATGTFTNCIGGDNAFAGYLYGTASGTFTNCTGGDYTFGSYGTASGTFTNCTGGDAAFGGLAEATGGRFRYCVGGVISFGRGAAETWYCIKDGAAYP